MNLKEEMKKRSREKDTKAFSKTKKKSTEKDMKALFKDTENKKGTFFLFLSLTLKKKRRSVLDFGKR